MTKEEAKEAIKESYGNSEYTDEIIKALEQFTWRNPQEPPKIDEYVLLSYSNCSLPDIGRYREDGKYYPGNDERSCESFGLIVDGWMPMPKVRRELGAE